MEEYVTFFFSSFKFTFLTVNFYELYLFHLKQNINNKYINKIGAFIVLNKKHYQKCIYLSSGQYLKFTEHRIFEKINIVMINVFYQLQITICISSGSENQSFAPSGAKGVYKC